MMTDMKRWQVDIFIDEHDAKTRAEARLINPDHTHLVGVGPARRKPVDPTVPEVGDELAVSRALAHLAHQLFDSAVDDVWAINESPLRLDS